MRIAAVTSSGAEAAPAVSPTLGARLDDLIVRASKVDWTPWMIVALGAFLRLLLLGIKPPHFDEGINGWFVDQMVKNGFYRYDPTNYHGPLHFYVLFLAQTLLGRNLWAIRLPVVLLSIFSIHLTLKFEPFVGRNVSRLAALAMAVSPGFVFYGRYSIHEVWLLVFSMLFMLGLLGLWRRGTVGYLWCTGMGLAGMILTKETYIIHVGCAVIAALVTWVSHKITRIPDAQPVRQTWTYIDLAVVFGAGAALIVFFYSGAFMNWTGVTGLYKTFQAWFQTGNKGNGHEKSAYNLFWPNKSWVNYYWLALLVRYEWPALLGLVLCAACQWFKHLGLRYLAIYSVGTLIAYSLIAYKTPWCIISFAWPFLFLFGGVLLLVPVKYIRSAYIGLGVLLCVSLGLCIRLNYFHYTTDTEPYVYVQSYRDIWKLTRPLLRLAKDDPTNYQLVGHLIRGSTYPLPWMLGDFTRIGYYEGSMPDKLDGDFLLVQQDKIEVVEAKLHESYYTEPLTIRQYQDPSKLYLNIKVFHKLFRGRAPDFVGKPAP